MSEEIKCPKCGSTQLTANKQGFSGKKAVAGAVLTGGIGVLAGTIGSNKVKITCLACGHVFNPGEGVVKQDGPELKNNFQTELSDLDKEVIAIIKSAGMLSAIKYVKEKQSIELSAAKEVVDRIQRENNVTPAKPTGCAGIIIFLIITGFISYLII